MSPAIEAFTDNVRQYCAWVESEKHDILTVRQILLALLQGIPQLSNSHSSAPDFSKYHGGEYPERRHEGWKVDYQRVADFPFQYYRDIFNPLDLDDETSTMGSAHDDLADIYGELWHGLKALELGDVNYAVEHWRESYFIHWGQHATSVLYAMDHYFRENR